MGRRTRELVGAFGANDWEGEITAGALERAQGAFGARTEMLVNLFTGRPRTAALSGMVLFHAAQHLGEAATVRAPGSSAQACEASQTRTQPSLGALLFFGIADLVYKRGAAAGAQPHQVGVGPVHLTAGPQRERRAPNSPSTTNPGLSKPTLRPRTSR